MEKNISKNQIWQITKYAESIISVIKTIDNDKNYQEPNTSAGAGVAFSSVTDQDIIKLSALLESIAREVQHFDYSRNNELRQHLDSAKLMILDAQVLISYYEHKL